MRGQGGAILRACVCVCVWGGNRYPLCFICTLYSPLWPSALSLLSVSTPPARPGHSQDWGNTLPPAIPESRGIVLDFHIANGL